MKNEFDIEVMSEEEMLLEELDKSNNANKNIENYRKIARAGIAQWVDDFKQNRIKINTVEDLERFIKLDLMLQEKNNGKG
ncbi:hypothetical protein [Niallia taxi]|uniref:hypothetical protein n=1 Tax=Niallia taxi TaxID=2499688 RepID=UPI00300BC49B